MSRARVGNIKTWLPTIPEVSVRDLIFCASEIWKFHMSHVLNQVSVEWYSGRKTLKSVFAIGTGSSLAIDGCERQEVLHRNARSSSNTTSKTL